jgi:hypothetical protein
LSSPSPCPLLRSVDNIPICSTPHSSHRPAFPHPLRLPPANLQRRYRKRTCRYTWCPSSWLRLRRSCRPPSPGSPLRKSKRRRYRRCGPAAVRFSLGNGMRGAGMRSLHAQRALVSAYDPPPSPCLPVQERSRRSKQKSYPIEDNDVDEPPEDPLHARPMYVRPMVLANAVGVLARFGHELQLLLLPPPPLWLDQRHLCGCMCSPQPFIEDDVPSSLIGNALMAWDFVKTFSREGGVEQSCVCSRVLCFSAVVHRSQR